MKKYIFKPRFFAVTIATCLMIGGFSIAKIDAACSENLPGKTSEPRTMPIYESVVDEPEPEPEPALISLGEFTLSHYCIENYPHICNDGDSTYTASGTRSTPGRSIAADPTVLPYGTHVMINGHEYVVEDCGSAIQNRRIDIMVNTHAEALSLGMKTAEVFIIAEVEG